MAHRPPVLVALVVAAACLVAGGLPTPAAADTGAPYPNALGMAGVAAAVKGAIGSP